MIGRWFAHVASILVCVTLTTLGALWWTGWFDYYALTQRAESTEGRLYNSYIRGTYTGLGVIYTVQGYDYRISYVTIDGKREPPLKKGSDYKVSIKVYYDPKQPILASNLEPNVLLFQLTQMVGICVALSLFVYVWQVHILFVTVMNERILRIEDLTPVIRAVGRYVSLFYFLVLALYFSGILRHPGL